MNWRFLWLGVASLAPALPAQLLQLDPLVVSAARSPQSATQVPFSMSVISGQDLRAAPTATLDGALRAVPGFSLFRRGDSLTANPTTQGVSLRGLGPSGASRSLVLLDGMPLNDPFGGWVAWSKVPRETLAGAELVRGGGGTAWGNAALGGVVQLLTIPIRSNQSGYSAAESSGRLAGAPNPVSSRSNYKLDWPEAGRGTVWAGAFSTRSAELALSQKLGPGTLQIAGRDFSTDGFALVAPERRGPIDVPAGSRHHWLTARWSQPVGADAELTFTARTFAETRGNGTPYQRNAARETFGALSLHAQSSPAFAWTASAYGQDQTFASTFSSVNATRTAETPASDQFAVPATALGAAWTGTWTQPDGTRTTAGADLRRVRGETREHFTFINGAYTRRRVAGGAQDIGGIFALREQSVAADLRATAGARLDSWRESDGHRRESDLATNSASRDDHYAGRTGIEFSPSAGLIWQATPAWRLRAAVQQAFRRPTLNELYRPFRAGSVITEANVALRTERVTSAEIGADYTTHDLTLSAALFWNELHDAVGNITVARGPGTFPLFGTLSAAGVGRQRLNLDRTRVRGAELSAEWRPTGSVTLSASYLYDDTAVLRASVAPSLVGRRLAQVPRQSAAFGATWRAPHGLTFTPRVRWLGRQFEDDENLLLLGAVVIADVNVSYPLTTLATLFLGVENIGNARIETGRSTDGVVNTGTPRLFFGGVRTAW